MSTTPGQFANLGLDLLTGWQQNYERLVAYASVFEARGGMGQFTNAKAVAAPGEELTPQQVAGNAELDALGAAALDVVTHFNLLREWYDAGKQARVAIRRTDY